MIKTATRKYGKHRNVKKKNTTLPKFLGNFETMKKHHNLWSIEPCDACGVNEKQDTKTDCLQVIKEYLEWDDDFLKALSVLCLSALVDESENAVLETGIHIVIGVFVNDSVTIQRPCGRMKPHLCRLCCPCCGWGTIASAALWCQ